jgi:hypothetical protein
MEDKDAPQEYFESEAMVSMPLFSGSLSPPLDREKLYMTGQGEMESGRIS